MSWAAIVILCADLTNSLYDPKGVATQLKVLQGGGRDWGAFLDCVERRGFGRTAQAFDVYEAVQRRWTRLINEGAQGTPEFLPAGIAAATVIVILVATCGSGARFDDADVAKAMRHAVRSWLGPDAFPIGESDESQDWLSRLTHQCRQAGVDKDAVLDGYFKKYLRGAAA